PVAARAAHDVDRVLMAFGSDQPDFRAPFLNDRVRADGGAMREESDVVAEVVERDTERLRAGAERVHHAAREIGRRRGYLGGEQLPGAIDDRAVGERAADVDADQIAHGVYISGHSAEIVLALGATIYNFAIQLSHVDRGVYESLVLKVARHPSEAQDHLVARVLAYCLELTEGLSFSRGLSDPDEPALAVRDLTG